jgi:hypothetical protein
MRQSHKFRLGLIKSDSGSLTIVRRQSQKPAPKCLGLPAGTAPQPGSPPIKPEGGREKTTAGFAVRSLNQSNTSGIAGLSNHVR